MTARFFLAAIYISESKESWDTLIAAHAEIARMLFNAEKILVT